MGSRAWSFGKICRKNPHINNNKDFPKFIYSSGKLTLVHESVLPPCCESPGECRPYVRGKAPDVRVVGMYCKNCHAEWLDKTVHHSSKFNKSDGIEVTECDVKDASLEMTTSGVCDVTAKQSNVLFRRYRSSDGISDFLRFLLISIPSRTMIERGSRDMDRLRPGDQVMWHRPWAVWHHQLIKRRTGPHTYDIIHFDTRNDVRCGWKVEIREKHARNFIEEHGTLYRVNYSSTVRRENPETLVFDRAKAKLHERDYNLFTNNCEHAITFCKTGCFISYQERWLKKEILFLILRAVIIAVVISLASIVDDSITELSPVSDVRNQAITAVPPKVPYATPFTLTPMTPNNATPYTTPESDKSRQDTKSEIIELVSIPAIELLMFLFVCYRHIKAFRERGIDKADLSRCVLEALVELFLTVSFYCSHVLILFLIQKPSLFVDILLGVSLGVAGKLVGFFFGQCICQKRAIKCFSSSLFKRTKSDLLLDYRRSSSASYSSLETSSHNQLA